MKAPDVPTFKSWLAVGLGRAAVFLKEHDAGPYLDELLFACTHYVSYDIQCEADRVPYLWRLIELSKNQAFFRNAIYQILKEGKENTGEMAWSQVFGLARHFAMQEDWEMKKAMYDAFAGLGFEKSGRAPAEELVLLDGIDGFIFAAERFDLASRETEIWEFDVVLRSLEDKLGKDQARIQITKNADKDEKLKKLLATVDKERMELELRHVKPERLDYSAWKIKTFEEAKPFSLVAWAKTASLEELQVVVDDLGKEADYQRLVPMLRVFEHRPFPGNVEVLLALADDQRKMVRHGAVRALRNVQHPSVRSRALNFLHSADRHGDGIDLLVGNYEAGDFKLIEQILIQPGNSDTFHSIGFSVQELVKRNPVSEAEKSLLLLYEKNPCSMCRTYVVRSLRALQKLPEWMKQECLYDAEEETAKVVQEKIV